MELNELRAALEAILFVSTEPVRIDDLVDSFPEASREAIAEQLDTIKQTLDQNVGGFTLEQTAGGWRLATRAEHDPVLKKYFSKKGENRLSIAALETLAIIAYRQPMTAPEISDIRGVNSTAVIRTLLERRMIRVAGRKNVVGSPFLYRTTKEFLVHFGLNDIRDLPRLEEFGDLIGESMSDDLVAAIASAAPTPASEMREITDADERDRAQAEALAELAGNSEEAAGHEWPSAGSKSDAQSPATADEESPDTAEPQNEQPARDGSPVKTTGEDESAAENSSRDEVESPRSEQE
jgi:segregation and condensation protein B